MKSSSKPPILPPEKLPDPWLFDTTALLKELDRLRDLILQIPVSQATFGPTNTAVSTLWELRERLRYLALYQRQGQMRWQNRNTPLEAKPAGTETQKKHRGAA
jgi:hypothetical protein